MIKKFLLWVSLLVVAGSARADNLPPAGQVRIDPLDYLVQLACNGPGDFLRCLGTTHRQLAGEVAKYRRHDLPAPTGYQISDCTLLPDGTVPCQFSYAPFGPLVVKNGDGGDLHVVTDGVVRVKLTQDGGRPGVLQHFVGPECGGDGWVSFRNDVRTGAWTSMVARLSDTPDGRCPRSLGNAYTRWRVEDVPWTFYQGATPRRMTLSTVISEHYDRADIASASALERFYYAKGAGRVRWSAWTKAKPPSVDLSARCPEVPFDVAPDDSGWKLADCRTWTAIEPPQDASWRDAMFGWPPASN